MANIVFRGSNITPPETKATIVIGEGITWNSRKRFNWFNRMMMKACFGWTVKNID